MDTSSDNLPSVSDISPVKPSSNDMLELDESDDSLPPLSKIFPVEPLTTGISKGDIVWAKYKKLYWPALVRNIYKKEKKVSVWFADDPGKTFKFPVKSVYSFHDVEMTQKIENEAIEEGCLEIHERLTSHAWRYLERKEKGYKDDPMKFFDPTYPFFRMEEYLKKNPDDDISDLNFQTHCVSHEKERKVCARKSKTFQKALSSSSKSDLESTDSDSESNSKDVSKDYLSLISQAISPSKSNDKDTVKIVKFVKSGKSDDYLKKILKKLVPSKHQDAYERELKDKKIMPSLSNTGPIDDKDKILELFDYLSSLYNTVKNAQMEKRNSSRRRTNKDKKFNQLTLKCDNPNYVCSVWLPEAIIYAMSHVHNISLENAWQLFEKRPEFDSGVVESIFSQLDSEDKNFEFKPKRKCHQRSKNSSSAKKICF